MAKHTALWSSRPDTDDFRAALNYLDLQFPSSVARQVARKARKATPILRVAKDILRASNLPLLPPQELHVSQDLKRIQKKKKLSPIVLLQGDLTKGRPLVIADGYHRVCAACHANEDAPVAAVLVKL